MPKDQRREVIRRATSRVKTAGPTQTWIEVSQEPGDDQPVMVGIDGAWMALPQAEVRELVRQLLEFV